MTTAVLLSALLVLMQLGGAYLRYLPFCPYMEPGEKQRLWLRLFLWSAVWLFLGTMLLSWSMLHVAIYKSILFFGWLPYFLISLTVIRNRAKAHIFVLGMQSLWALALHTLVAMGENAFVTDSVGSQLPFLHQLLYLGLFLVLLPLSRKMFLKLLPSPHLFAAKDTALSELSISLLPFAIFVGLSMPIADAEMLHSFKVQLSRLSIPVFFFFIYRALSIATQKIDAKRQEEHTMTLMNEQISSLEEYNRSLQETQEQAETLSRETQKYYETLLEYLKRGEIELAKAFIKSREKQLDVSGIQSFSSSPLVNATLSVYIGRARELGIPMEARIRLPEDFGADEHDFSVLLSHLLENALKASRKEPEGSREITIDIAHQGRTCVLEIANRSEAPLPLDEKGLPITDRKGHDLPSLSAFLETYHAYADFSQKDGWVRMTMYWECDI
ncbi:MAG: GHKL domain-containing protein [Selenomonadaceae bacterium]|nr:GHKL domain-containing protein [Selenomonadaceae bacterium]